MGTKQGWAMVSGKTEMLDMFSKWNIGKTEVIGIGAITVLTALLILFSKIFVRGNFLMAAGILLIICFHLLGKDWRGVAIELPFFLLNWSILNLQHPLIKTA